MRSMGSFKGWRMMVGCQVNWYNWYSMMEIWWNLKALSPFGFPRDWPCRVVQHILSKSLSFKLESQLVQSCISLTKPSVLRGCITGQASKGGMLPTVSNTLKLKLGAKWMSSSKIVAQGHLSYLGCSFPLMHVTLFNHALKLWCE